MVTKIRCITCNHQLQGNPRFTAHDAKSTKKPYKYYLCPACLGTQIDPIINLYQRQKIYSYKDIHQDFLKDNTIARILNHFPFFEYFFRIYLQSICNGRKSTILKLKKTGSIFDFGFGDAQLLKALNIANWQIAGLEVNKVLVGQAKKKLKNAVIYDNKLEKIKLPPNKYDIITIWHVLEHLKNPQSTINTLKLSLKTGGYIVIEVPNGDSLFFKIFRAYWQQVIPPEHLFFYTAKSLKIIIQKSGLEPVSVHYPGFFSFSGVSSLSNLLKNHKLSPTVSAIISIAFFPLIMLINILSLNYRENLQVIAQKIK